MFDRQLFDPNVFINALRQFQDTEPDQRGSLANALSDAIIGKRVDLGEVRRNLIDAGDAELMDTLDRFLELIEPYLQESGSDD